MVEERTCDYTGEPIEPGTGIMYVRADGSVLHFADAKAEKNYFKGREARDLEWTDVAREAKAERPTEASTEPADAEPTEPGSTEEAEDEDTGESAADEEDTAAVDSAEDDESTADATDEDSEERE